MPTIKTDWQGLKGIASELLKAMSTLNYEELQGGLNCFNLAYLGFECCSDFEEYQAVLLFGIVNKAAIKREFELTTKGV